MGEVADSMIEGESCSLCMVIFKQSHGYEVLCKECKRDNPNDPRQDAVYPVIEEMRG